LSNINDLAAVGRLLHHHPALGREDYGSDVYALLPAVGPSEANVVSSLLTNGMHAPALDLDFTAHLFESRTPGHHHLYLDQPMSWRQYRKLLRVLAGVGIVEQGYAASAIANGRSLLRVPGSR
jgi:hypothetical protein